MKSLFPLLFVILFSCNNTGKIKETVEAIAKTDSCQLDSQNNYEIYIPQRNNANEKLPLLIIIDAHGNGAFALEKFKLASNQFPVMLVASNLIKNGFVNYEGAIKILLEDVRQKYPAGETVFMTGFSGGARMALGYGLTHQLSGLILCGALANANQVKALHCPVISISGMDDFNFMETAQFLFQEQSIPKNLKIELTNASHNWPDSLMLTNALGFIYLSNVASKPSSVAKSQISDFCETQTARINTFENGSDFLKAALVARNMSTTTPFNDDKIFASKYKDLIANPEYTNQLDRLKECLNFEIKARQPYIDAFAAKDSSWWKNEINNINEKIKTEKDPYRNDMYHRIKGFWGIACYTFGNQAVKEKNAEMLNKIVSVYRMVEPENPYVLYFSAFPVFWNGNNEASLSILKKALEAGFSETSQIKNDFPESITSKL